MANVRKEVVRIKTILINNLEIVTTEDYDPFLVQRVNIFLSSLDNVFIQAGSSLNMTHGFLFNFYGLIATYIAILLSTSSR